MNVGELLRERDRLLGVIEEAKTARAKLRQLNIVIALYGDDDKVALNGAVPKSVVNGHVSTASKNKLVTCAKCGEQYKGVQGLAVHNRIRHGGKYRVKS